MDHDVEHDADIGRPKGIGTRPLGPDVPRRSCQSAGHLGGRVEPLDMSHLQSGLCPFGGRHDGGGLSYGRGEWFLDKDGDPAVEEFGGHRLMSRGGHGNGNGVDLSKKTAEIGEPAGAARLGHGLTPIG